MCVPKSLLTNLIPASHITYCIPFKHAKVSRKIPVLENSVIRQSRIRQPVTTELLCYTMKKSKLVNVNKKTILTSLQKSRVYLEISQFYHFPFAPAGNWASERRWLHRPGLLGAQTRPLWKRILFLSCSHYTLVLLWKKKPKGNNKNFQ